MRRKNPDDVFEQYRLVWQTVRYEPGTVTVVAYDENGDKAQEKHLETAGAAAGVHAAADRSPIRADGEDLAFVTLQIQDASHRMCPTADNRVYITVEGPGELLAMDNGDPTDLDPFGQPHRRAFNGLALAIVRSWPGQPGQVHVQAQAAGLASDSVTVKTQ